MQEPYPSGRLISTLYNNLRWETGVAGSYNGTGTSYVGNVSYWPHGRWNGISMATTCGGAILSTVGCRAIACGTRLL
jgi:hypothetical protein